MAGANEPARRVRFFDARARFSDAIARLSTSAKLIAILSFALMPLGIIALLASLQSARTADIQRESDLRIAATEATRKLATELASDSVALREAVVVVDVDMGTPRPCLRADTILHARSTRAVPFALFGPSGAPLCAIGGLLVRRPAMPLDRSGIVFRRTGDALDIIVPSPGGTSVAVARYSTAMLAEFARPSGYGLAFRQTLDIDGTPLLLSDRNDTSLIDRTETVTMPVGVGQMTLTMTVASASFGATEALLTFLPLLMWASAAIVGFYVVERLLLRPLRSLRAAVTSYVPGSTERFNLGPTPSVEIRELGATFTAFADRQSEHERDLKSSLDDQVRLTREVHHRVKNNLQVIASLISLHARGTSSPDAQNAYVGIQRRVDALAVVHRNHYAELENATGIELKQLLGELASNFRASVGQGHVGLAAPQVTVAADPIVVAQDTAMPLAFLFTEIAEIALIADPTSPISVSATRTGNPGLSRLTISSPALTRIDTTVAQTSIRIVDGLARQLRAPLMHDPLVGSYAIDFAAIDPAPTA